MHFLRDANSVQSFLADSTDTELSNLIRGRIAEIVDFDDVPLSDLVHFIILTPNDTKLDLDSVSGWSVDAHSPECIEAHTDWLELTFILSDDGFGLVIYIPRNTEDEAFRHLYLSHCTPAGAERSK